MYNYSLVLWSLSEAPGISVFFRDEDNKIYHTYPTDSRSIDMLNVAYHYMDLVPKGRDEGDGWWYTPIAKLLADEYKVITYDLRANARSTMN